MTMVLVDEHLSNQKGGITNETPSLFGKKACLLSTIPLNSRPPGCLGQQRLSLDFKCRCGLPTDFQPHQKLANNDSNFVQMF